MKTVTAFHCNQTPNGCFKIKLSLSCKITGWIAYKRSGTGCHRLYFFQQYLFHTFRKIHERNLPKCIHSRGFATHFYLFVNLFFIKKNRVRFWVLGSFCDYLQCFNLMTLPTDQPLRQENGLNCGTPKKHFECITA